MDKYDHLVGVLTSVVENNKIKNFNEQYSENIRSLFAILLDQFGDMTPDEQQHEKVVADVKKVIQDFRDNTSEFEIMSADYLRGHNDIIVSIVTVGYLGIVIHASIHRHNTRLNEFIKKYSHILTEYSK